MRTRIFNPLAWVEASQRRAALRQAYRSFFKTEAGRLVLADILREGACHSAMQHPGRDQRQLVFIEGKRALAHTILRKAGLDVDRLPEALVADTLEEMNHDGPTANPYGVAAQSGQRPAAGYSAGYSAGDAAGRSEAADPDISFGD